MGGLLWTASGQTLDWTNCTIAERLLRLSVLIAAGGLSYAIAALALGLRPRHLLRMNPIAT